MSGEVDFFSSSTADKMSSWCNISILDHYLKYFVHEVVELRAEEEAAEEEQGKTRGPWSSGGRQGGLKV